MDRLVPLYGCMWVQPIVDSISLVVSSILCWRIYQTERLSPPRNEASSTQKNPPAVHSAGGFQFYRVSSVRASCLLYLMDS